MDNRKKFRIPPGASSLWGLLMVLAGLLVLGIAGCASAAPSSAPPAARPAAAGPRLGVDRDLIDLGKFAFNQPAQADFMIENTGNAPLEILGEPKVDLIQGC